MLHLIHSEDVGMLPTSLYKLFDEEKEVGILQIRHHPSVAKNLPYDMASHIYYEIQESERGKGYGNAILDLAKIEARKIGLNELLLSVWEGNIASKKIIEKNNGVLFRSWMSPEKGEKFLLYRLILL